MWTFGGAVLAAVAVAGCINCRPAYFTRGAHFDVTVVQASAFDPPSTLCEGGPATRPRSLADGDAIEAIGTGDQGSESCDDGAVRPLDTPQFATDILTTCSGNFCQGMTAAGCLVTATMYTTLDYPIPATGIANGTLRIQWNSGCDAGFKCSEEYDVAFIRRDN